jgi:hypothetical protein
VRSSLETSALCFCLDATGKTPAVWVADRRGVRRLEPRGDGFEKTAELAALGPLPTIPKLDGRPILACTPQPRQRAYVTADPYREEIYLKEPDNCYGAPLTRLDGRTGKPVERLLPALDSYVGPDRLLYTRSRTHPQHHWLLRYDPDARKYLPFPDNHFSAAGSRKGVPGGTPAGPYFPSPKEVGGRNYQAMMCVAPNGDLYVPVRMSAPMVAEIAKAGLPVPAKPGGRYSLLTILSPTGELRTPSALDGRALGLQEPPKFRVGRNGAVYMSQNMKPVDQKVPDGLEPDAKYGPDWGTLVKFDSAFGRFPVGSVRMGREVEKPTHKGYLRAHRIRFENAAWDYGGIAPMVENGCTCTGYSFDLDRFERVFLPAAQTCTINVLDANGNVIVRAGGYGNTDSLGAGSPVADPETGLLRPRRPDDPPELKSPLAEPDLGLLLPQYLGVTDEAIYVLDGGNFRLLRAVLTYRSEETVPLP